MALWMEDGSNPLTENEKADLDAIAALKESSALEFKVFLYIIFMFWRVLNEKFYFLVTSND